MIQEFPNLDSERLKFRELRIDDAEEFHEMANYPDGDLQLQEVIDKINQIRLEIALGNAFSWKLMLNGTLIGTCGYYRGFENNSGEVGFVLKEKYRRKGYMTEALKTTIPFGFQKLNLKRICAFTLPSNEPTQQLLLKLGFQLSNEKHEKYLIFELFKH